MFKRFQGQTLEIEVTQTGREVLVTGWAIGELVMNELHTMENPYKATALYEQTCKAFEFVGFTPMED